MAAVVHPWAGHGGEVLISSFIGAMSAQFIKLFADWFQHRKPNFKLLVETGGMPSSHSSAMTAMACSVGLVNGFNSVDFAISLSIAFVVMYDAAGVRQAAGRMAMILNNMVSDFYMEHPEYFPERLRELLGHTPFQVIVGGILGFVAAYGVHIGL